MNNKYSIADKYFILWAFFIPISSWVIDPTIKGSLISYLLAFLSPLIIICFQKNIAKKYFLDMIEIILVLLLFALISQLANAIYNISLYGTLLVNPGDFDNKIFRNSLITQNMYLIPVILTFLYVKYLYKPSWDKWIIYGGLVFVLYGFYKWLGFLITGADIDFLTNRTFGDSDTVLYQYQGIMLAGMSLQRFQSLTGEPSMFAFTMLPYFIFAIHRKANNIIIIIMGLSILLSVSSTAYLGLVIYVVYMTLISKKKKNFFYLIIGLIVSCLILYMIFSEYIDVIMDMVIFNKMDSVSGMTRSNDFWGDINYFMELDIMHSLFGIGFGYIRSSNLFTTLLVNTGIIGVLSFSYFYLKDFSLKAQNFIKQGNNSIILVLFVISMVAVPEFSYLSFWIFLAISKNNNIRQY
ncbi:hypothetical protein B5F82_04665 [Megamonas hypermegale]|uniref:hypothetical protein n=1 Tax=Megamonas hypermegale TaxID=158847 RepID=UPI000B38083E|nr:hypothetical protein [Megamonas hypermegale]OUO40463.1 hypothetical protein B5F82_04665 [Megamonas hypermegale]